MEKGPMLVLTTFPETGEASFDMRSSSISHYCQLGLCLQTPSLQGIWKD